MQLSVFFEQLRKDHPHLQFIINEDALSPNAPHIKDMKRYNLHYILGVKPGDHKFLFGFVKDAVQDDRTIEFAIEDKDDPDITHRFCILTHLFHFYEQMLIKSVFLEVLKI